MTFPKKKEFILANWTDKNMSVKWHFELICSQIHFKSCSPGQRAFSFSFTLSDIILLFTYLGKIQMS